MRFACIQRHAVAHYDSIFYSNIVAVLQINSDFNHFSEKSSKLTTFKFVLM